MDLTTAIRTRRSEMHLVPPAPSHEEFIELLELAALSPDHGRLRPWRLILLRQGARHELGMRLSRECGPARTSETATKPLRAPLLATLVFSPYPDHRIPEWEQLSAAVGVANARCCSFTNVDMARYGVPEPTYPHPALESCSRSLNMNPYSAGSISEPRTTANRPFSGRRHQSPKRSPHSARCRHLLGVGSNRLGPTRAPTG